MIGDVIVLGNRHSPLFYKQTGLPVPKHTVLGGRYSPQFYKHTGRPVPEHTVVGTPYPIIINIILISKINRC